MQEQSLFDEPPSRDAAIEIPIRDAKLTFHACAFTGREADRYLDVLLESTSWRADTITIHGKSTPLPRLQAWYCEHDWPLNYSGMQVPALPWTDVLRSIAARLRELTGLDFNGVLVNCYRDGNDSVGWHSDDEAEWGPNPVIASVSFGATRDFVLKHRRDKTVKPVICPLTHGSLLVMGDTVQNAWQHQLPKRRRVTTPRVNLTFRNLLGQ
jgi:alkylated DNA repair dioxygenase AlkB